MILNERLFDLERRVKAIEEFLDPSGSSYPDLLDKLREELEKLKRESRNSDLRLEKRLKDAIDVLAELKSKGENKRLLARGRQE